MAKLRVIIVFIIIDLDFYIANLILSDLKLVIVTFINTLLQCGIKYAQKAKQTGPACRLPL
ncbi:hypothetical protein ACKWMY_13685 [Serratia sp. J2]|uniref:hypothetical protein n=1 Tax=Serratia sp. J2 TaxID=3386551 RepID=UPI0039176530